jgi:chromosome partition protein MukE
MSSQGFAQLQDVLLDDDFPELDLALRRGRHIDRDDAALYALLSDAQELLETFYRRFGCELVHKPDGYFYLLPTGDKLSRRQLAPGDMLVGQALALAYLDPASAARGGAISSEELIAQLSAVLGSDALIAAFNPKRKRFDERVAHKNVRSRVAEAARRLAALGFVELCEGDNLRLRPALMRFAEPVRGLSEPAEALAKLVAQGEVALAPEPGDEDLEEAGEDLDADDDADEELEAPEPMLNEEAVDDADVRVSDHPAALLEAPEPVLDDEAADYVDVRVSDHPAALLEALDQLEDEDSE